ncbi:hypothetical protein B0H14DRAFT_1302228 [Mycena olivaceomarginata]|nr:hypothetical protein B0H14DRAFT_1302228 [Mycena olivaceomarginata]
MRFVRQGWNSFCPASPPLSPARSPCHYPTQLHTGTLDPIRPSALPLPPHANANVHHSYSYSRPHMRTRVPRRRPRRPEELAILTNALLAAFGKDDTICGWRRSYTSSSSSSTSYTSPSTHSTHAVAFPVSPHRYTSAPTPTPAPTYTSTLTPATLGMPPTTRSVSSPPAPVRTSTSPTYGGKPKSSEEEEAESRLFPFLCPPHPLHRRRRQRSPPTARSRGWVRGG